MIEDPAADPDNVIWFSGDQLVFGNGGRTVRGQDLESTVPEVHDAPAPVSAGEGGATDSEPAPPAYVLFFNGAASDDPFA